MALKHKSPTIFEPLIKSWGIALTGGIATGKSTLAKILRDKGFTVIDADELAHRVVMPGLPALAAIVQTFGPNILDSTGHLDRKNLRNIIFADADARAKLDAIMHPAIRQELHEELARKGLDKKPNIFFYEAALIFETGSQKHFREVWATHCPRSMQLDRLEHQRGVPRAVAEKMLAGQMDASAKAAMANLAFDTAAPLESMAESVEYSLSLLQKAFRSEKGLQKSSNAT